MKKNYRKASTSQNNVPRPIVVWIVGVGLLILIICFAFRSGRRDGKTTSTPPATVILEGSRTPQPAAKSERPRARNQFPPASARPPEQIVAEKLSRFAQKRALIADAIAKSRGVTAPPDVARFFEAVQTGNWQQTTNLFASLENQVRNRSGELPFGAMWSAILETYGVAQQAHEWPAQRLLDYGNAILDSLRPGMVYVGGTDSGRFIPTLLNETTEGESHIVLTQNALADSTYLEYLRFLYGDRFSTLSAEDSQSGFSTYLQDAQKRLQHDQDNPDDPRQILPGEDIQKIENRVQVSGQVAVMQINELLLKTLMQKNPDLSFALQESFPFKTLYATASTLGPITELSANSSDSLTADRAAQSLDYWRSTTDALLADPDSASSVAVRDSYSKLMVSQANLFLDHNLSTAAEQAYQYAANLNPSQPEVVFGYTNLLLNQKRFAEATQLVQNAVKLAPDNAQFQGLLAQVNKLK
jgi:hypothetical protein